MNIGVDCVGQRPSRFSSLENVDFGREGLLRNNMKQEELNVVTVVRGVKVDIADMTAKDAALMCVPGLENSSPTK